MRSARTAAGTAGLRSLLAAPGEWLLAFDFDGTLAPIVTDPAQARPHPDALAVLRRLAPHVAALAIVTGRPAELVVELGEFSASADLGRFVVAGHYGLERWDASTRQVTAPDPHPGVEQVRAALPGLLAAMGAPAETMVEDKARSIAVHVRRAPDPEAALELLREPLSALAAEVGLVVEPGRLVLELRPPGTDKGAALRALVAEVGARGVLFAGDDLGDLTGYDAVSQLRDAGTKGVLVCAGSTEVQALAERADLVVDGPAGVVDLLTELADQIDASGPVGA